MAFLGEITMERVQHKIYFEKQGPMLENGMRISVRGLYDGDRYSCRHELKLTGEKYSRPTTEGIISLTDRQLSILMAGGTIIL